MQSAPSSAPPPDSRARPKTLSLVAERSTEPVYFSVETEAGETVAAELFERHEALQLACAEEGRVAWAHGRHPALTVFVRWRIA